MSRPRESAKCLHVRAIFGLWHAHSREEATRLARLANATARQILTSLAPGHIALVTGPSGSGKSTLLRAITARATKRRDTVIEGASIEIETHLGAPPRSRAGVDRSDSARVVDLFDLPIDQTLCVLAAAGLAEARVFTAVARELSEGQRDRLRLALALARAESPGSREPMLIVDEFAGRLDRITAHSVAASLRRWKTNTRIVCVTSHDDLRDSLMPDMHIELSMMGPSRIVAATRRGTARKGRGG